MQAKCEVFSRFGSSVDFSSGEPLGGVEAPTVGADLCVRPSSPERSLFCGRTRRSAPTQATSARQFYSSNAVTPISVGAHRSCVPTNVIRLGRWFEKLLYLCLHNPRKVICGNSSVGRASASQAEGREFEPRFPLCNE